MAQRVHIVLEDDLDGSEGVETVSFALDGKSYEIDLNEKNATKLRKALAPFIDAGRKASRASAPARKSTAAPAGTSPQEIRHGPRATAMTFPTAAGFPPAFGRRSKRPTDASQLERPQRTGSLVVTAFPCVPDRQSLLSRRREGTLAS